MALARAWSYLQPKQGQGSKGVSEWGAPCAEEAPGMALVRAWPCLQQKQQQGSKGVSQCLVISEGTGRAAMTLARAWSYMQHKQGQSSKGVSERGAPCAEEAPELGHTCSGSRGRAARE